MMKALRPHYPEVDHVRLIDYRFVSSTPCRHRRPRPRDHRIRDEMTHEIYGTVGVSENIIEASWIALVDGIEYSLINHEEATRRTGAKKVRKPRKP